MVLVLTKCKKFNDVQAAGSTVLKKVVLAVRKNCDNYHEKAVPAIRKSCDSYHEKAVPAIRKNCDSYHEKIVPTVRKSYLLWAVGAFRLLGRSFQHLLYGFWLKMVRSL